MRDFVDATAFNCEQGNRARKLFAAVVLAALDDAIADNKKYGNGPEMGHDSPAEAHCMGPRMEKGSSLRKEFSVEEAKKRMEERKRKEKAKEEAKK